MVVGRGIGPATSAPVRFAVSTISRVDWSRILWSYAFKRIRILSPCLIRLFDNLGDGAGADGVPAFANREPQALLQRYRRDQRHFAAPVVSRPHHLHSRPPLH